MHDSCLAAPTPDPAAGFARRVLAVVRRIPGGRVATYGDVAALAGRPGAARAVGAVMRHCREAGVPCHRVVAAGGRIGGYHDLIVKQGLLAAEGVRIARGRLLRFAEVRWPGAASRGGRRGPPAPRA